MSASTVETGNQQIVTVIVSVLEEVLNQELTDVTAETRLFDDLNLDSTGVLALLMSLEDALDMQVDPEDLQKSDLDSVGSLAAFVAGNR
ncbi:acyl carrier protein [Actinoplanes sp. G11-F43]|uniref:acyl carrier protein n=1 Tax=Actinoplanes sp. G11-F43 TaxID=3424130 RepID=UPI003D32DCAD